MRIALEQVIHVQRDNASVGPMIYVLVMEVDVHLGNAFNT